MDPKAEVIDPSHTDLSESVPEAILHFRKAVRDGAPWYEAILEAMALWTLPREIYGDRTYDYLILGEAFDWLVLAERLFDDLGSSVPWIVIGSEDRERLLFEGRLPVEIDPERSRNFWVPASTRPT